MMVNVIVCYQGIKGFMKDALHKFVSRMSHEKKTPGWLFDIGDYTTQLYGDYNRPL